MTDIYDRISLGFELEVHVPYREDWFNTDEEPSDHTPWGIRKKVAIALSEWINVDVKAPRRLRKIHNNWAVLPENDIDHYEIQGSYGVVEIVSPPLPLSNALDMFSEVCEFCRSNELFTSMLCGLHLNMSIDSWTTTARGDFGNFKLNLIQLIDERSILKEVGRTSTVYTNTHYDRLIPFAAYRLKLDSNYKPNRNLGDLIEASKEYAINFSNLNSNNPYIEFRHIGGESILDKEEWIKEVALDLANNIYEADIYFEGSPRTPVGVAEKIHLRYSEFLNDIKKTLEIYYYASPEIVIRKVDRGFLGEFERMFIATKFGDVSLVFGDDNFPTIALNVDNSMHFKVESDLLSQKVPLELCELATCYLIYKFKKFSNEKLPFEDLDSFVANLLQSPQ